MSIQLNRVPRGTSAGGRFSAIAHAEAQVSLFPPKHLVGAGQTVAIVNSRAAEGVPEMILTPEQVREVQGWIDVTGDFSYRTVRSQAEALYTRDNGYTPAECHAHVLSGGAPYSSHDPDAVRRDIEQMRKDSLQGALL